MEVSPLMTIDHGTNLCELAFKIHEVELTITRLVELGCSSSRAQGSLKYLCMRVMGG